jgi:hypothetical protein
MISVYDPFYFALAPATSTPHHRSTRFYDRRKLNQLGPFCLKFGSTVARQGVTVARAAHSAKSVRTGGASVSDRICHCVFVESAQLVTLAFENLGGDERSLKNVADSGGIHK